jgi:hypothetical protein
MARKFESLAVIGLGAALSVLGALAFDQPATGQDPQTKTTAKKKPAGKTAAKKPAAKAETPAAAETGQSGDIKFSRDIAPILVANCGNCHNPQAQQFRRSKFSLANFEDLMAGGASGPAIASGNPDDSLLVHRIKGEDGPKMPPGQNRLGDAAIAKITQWIKQGALLDAGNDPKAAMAKYAASPEDLRKAALAKMSVSDRDKQTEETARQRLTKADPAAKPEMTSSDHFLLFADMPKDRAKSVLKTMETQYAKINRLIPGSKAMGGPEKVGLYVFKERRGYTEFVRTVENAEVEPGDEARGKLGVEAPYVLAVDPAAGGAEPAAAATPKKGGRTKKASSEESSGGPERTLAGLLSEQLASSAVANSGRAPRWLSSGLGAVVSSSAEPRSSYYRRLRAEAFDQWRSGWATKAVEALGDQTKPETVKAVGFAVMEWMIAADASVVPNFVAAMLQGGEKLDDALANCLNASREQFLEATGEFVGGRYGR